MINCFMYVVYQIDILYLFGMANISFVNFIVSFDNAKKILKILSTNPYFLEIFQEIKIFRSEIFLNLSHNERI